MLKVMWQRFFGSTYPISVQWDWDLGGARTTQRSLHHVPETILVQLVPCGRNIVVMKECTWYMDITTDTRNTITPLNRESFQLWNTILNAATIIGSALLLAMNILFYCAGPSGLSLVQKCITYCLTVLKATVWSP